MKRSWLWQIVGIENKGYAAYEQGIPLENCPYQSGYRNQNGPGGSLQSQRRKAWRRGWLLAKQHAEEKTQ